MSINDEKSSLWCVNPEPDDELILRQIPWPRANHMVSLGFTIPVAGDQAVPSKEESCYMETIDRLRRVHYLPLPAAEKIRLTRANALRPIAYGTPAEPWTKVRERRMRGATTKAVLGRLVIPYGTNEISQTLFTGYPRITDIQVNELLQLLQAAGPTQLSTALQQLRGKGWVLDDHWRAQYPVGRASQGLDRQVQGDLPTTSSCNHRQSKILPLCWRDHHGQQDHAQMVATAKAVGSNHGCPCVCGGGACTGETGKRPAR
eukprot:6170701-Amphidinium_carterae.3